MLTLIHKHNKDKMIHPPSVLFLLSCLSLSVPIFAIPSQTGRQRDVMVWMCLDICGQGGENATKNLKELSHHLDVVSAISFEKYTLGPNATLVTFDITEVEHTP